MIRSLIINKYLFNEFLKTIRNTTLLFFCLGFVLNLFEEINFFKDFDISLYLPILLSALYIPSLLYEMFPFVVLLSGIWFFIKINKSDEVTAMKVSGMSNLSIILIPGIAAAILGILIITALNPISSVLVKKYENIKGKYEKDLDYLAAITSNGIWIKEKNSGKNIIIRSINLKDKNLMTLTIYEFNENMNFIKRIEAESADISSFEWKIKNAKIINSEGEIIEDDIKILSYKSTYNLEKIKSLYSNLDTISFWNIDDQIQILKERGYSTKDMEAKLHRSFAYPFFLLSMILLSGVFILGTNLKDNNLAYIFMTIITSVVIYFFNDLSSVMGKTEKIPIAISVWMPIVIIFIFGTVGAIHANQK